MPKLSIAGLDQVELIARLYESAGFMGMTDDHYGLMLAKTSEFVKEEGVNNSIDRSIVERYVEKNSNSFGLFIDYVDFGLGNRSIKICLDKGKQEINTDFYDRDNGIGRAAAVIQEMRGASVGYLPSASTTYSKKEKSVHELLAQLEAGRARFANEAKSSVSDTGILGKPSETGASVEEDDVEKLNATRPRCQQQ